MNKQLIYFCSICENNELMPNGLTFGQFNQHLINEHSKELLSQILGLLNMKYNDFILRQMAYIEEKDLK